MDAIRPLRRARAATVVVAAACGLVGCSAGDIGSSPTGPNGAPITTRAVRPADEIALVARATDVSDRCLVRTSSDEGAPCEAGPEASLPLSALVRGAEVTIEDGVKPVGRASLGAGAVLHPEPDSWMCAWVVAFDPGPPDGVLSVSVDGTLVGNLDVSVDDVVDMTGDVIDNLPATGGT